MSPTSTPKLTPTVSINLKKSDIIFQSKIVKEINDKYRYFFDIRNHGSASFKGKISISLYNKEGSFITETAFSTDELVGTAYNQQIPPELGMNRYVEAHTGPVKIHGVFGISEYKYEVIEDGKTIKKDTGTITSEFESIEY
ncbi:hypothetical protein A2W14_03725 [Candidatus Gottesmanbacteria bacterium RBG_16_37_8]|uniref:Uncharacterized protein n=1 Tax=Candidatus Gottesmanbacteria bacterium RBG_16_37_8 TaxID=1798371 RepID=A0A1F5YNB6_9BACT|nr:MAG: hypothetical protein A2W14_03725 [Candidatus Gottesmanbacteria bacterium RBG_16_37_8]